MASPSPTGTFTLKDTPDFAWRETGMSLTCRIFGQVVSFVGTSIYGIESNSMLSSVS
jgi:hypothetical protein